jgi:predicted Zn-ribbon and HTH transcriptional regulator
VHKVCPNCKSDEILSSYFFVTGHYKCLNCGYEGAFIMEMDDYEYQKFLSIDESEEK